MADESKACGGCGAESLRRRVVFTAAGKVETCSQCDPDLREQPVASSTDRKLWMGHEVEPERYTKVEKPTGEVIFESTDEKRVDDEAAWTKQDDAQESRAERIMAQRRSMGRKTPLTESETLCRLMEVQSMLERRA